MECTKVYARVQNALAVLISSRNFSFEVLCMFQYDALTTRDDPNNVLGDLPVYLRPEDGQTSPNPLPLLGSHPTFSLRKLALELSPPALVGEFHPESPWLGITRLRPSIKWPQATYNPDDICTRFRKSVATSIGDASTIAVLASGGLDSTAIL